MKRAALFFAVAMLMVGASFAWTSASGDGQGGEAGPNQSMAVCSSVLAVFAASAQTPARAAGQGRYWASSWATNTSHGIYVVDTQTGEVFSVTNESKPMSLGKPAGK